MVLSTGPSIRQRFALSLFGVGCGGGSSCGISTSGCASSSGIISMISMIHQAVLLGCAFGCLQGICS